MGAWIWTFLTPAFIATLVSILIANRAEKLRAHRDFVTKTFEAARDDVRQAVTAATAYFPLAAKERTPMMEAQVWLAERDLRFSLTAIIDNADPAIEAEALELRQAFDDLIALLTGGSFQDVSSEADVKQARQVASAGAELRSRLMAVRQAALRTSVKRDPINRFLIYWTEPLGISSK